jgi:hypothetical protein
MYFLVTVSDIYSCFNAAIATYAHVRLLNRVSKKSFRKGMMRRGLLVQTCHSVGDLQYHQSI